jgi:hypothetical protein
VRLCATSRAGGFFAAHHELVIAVESKQADFDTAIHG